MAKMAKSFRLSEATVKELEAMSKRWRIGRRRRYRFSYMPQNP